MSIYDYYITPEEYEQAESNGIDRWTVERRIRDFCWSKERAITEKKKRYNYYGDLVQTAIKNGIKRNTFYARIDRGMCPEKAATQKTKNRSEIKAPIPNRLYPDWVYKNLKQNKINRTTFWKRVNEYGWPLEKASTMKPLKRGQRITSNENHYFRKAN